MELRHLEHFVAAAEEGHFTRAAHRVNIVQSGLSLSIRTLETELGVRLFTRTARGVVLTPAGRALLPEARRVMAAAKRARHSVADVDGSLSGTVSIGLSIALPPDLDAPGLISDFRAAHQAVRVRLVHETSPKTFDLVRAGTLDFAVAATAGSPPADLTTLDLGTSPMVFVCAKNHRLASRRSVTVTAIADETFIDFQTDWTVRKLVDIAFDSAGLARDTAYVVNETTYLMRFVERGLAVALLPLVYMQLHPDARFIRVRPTLPPWRAVGAHLGDQPASAAARALMNIFCDQVRLTRRMADQARY